MYFQKRNTYTAPLFRNSKILRFSDKVAVENCLFICKCLNRTLPPIFNNWFTLSLDSHDHYTRWSELGCLKKPYHRTKIYGRFSFIVSAIYSWNYLQKQHNQTLFYQLTITKLREILHAFFISKYC